MSNTQIPLFVSDQEKSISKDVKEWGTFKDSLKAPVHRWFTYPAGFSYKAVEHSFERYGISKGMTVYDPFMGSGTTNLVAKSKGINSVGVEAHPFVINITRAKMHWDVDFSAIDTFKSELTKNFQSLLEESNKSIVLEDTFPELILKCYSRTTLMKLLVIRDYFNKFGLNQSEYDFVFVAITALLRGISSAATGWPYIAPNKAKVTSEDKDAVVELMKILDSMKEDLLSISDNADPDYNDFEHRVLLGNSKDVTTQITSESVDHIFTSPPYLNNFDYSDRTRLELYFWGHASSWKDISQNVRTKLMTSATTQILRSDPKYKFKDEFKETCPEVYKFLQNAVDELGELRKVKGGKKSYDLMVVGYFNDIFEILKESFRVLKPNTKALFVLGDSAPYGVHIPTDILVGEIGCCIGFDSFDVEVLRKRGDKWKANPQRHNIPLQESIIILEKK
ncbi:TPA: hypothetical protein NJ487_004415 [Vibrio parahaemolyticus]|nr:hypothetical protein [Vibrio parahaemolyticus]